MADQRCLIHLQGWVDVRTLESLETLETLNDDDRRAFDAMVEARKWEQTQAEAEILKKTGKKVCSNSPSHVVYSFGTCDELERAKMKTEAIERYIDCMADGGTQ